ncbi:MAG: EAL domain-containing protein [Sulfurovum sp.]|nr:EAL domain-containing protein [Sulfurovum sp.]
MNFLDNFTLYDVFLVAIGLVLASLIRIFYDSFKEKKRLKKLGQMIKVYNESMDVYEEGVLIITDKNEVIFANKEASRIFAVKNTDVTMKHLSKKVGIRISGSIKEESFIETIQKRRNIPHAYIVVGSSTVPVSLNTNKFHMQYNHNDSWRIVILQDIANKIKLQERIDSIGSYKDLLTNLPTRYHLTSDLVSVILKATQNNHESAIGMFGLQDFNTLQVINSISKMDLVLRNIARDIVPLLENNETIYRLDCDAYAIVFEDIEDRGEARRRLDWIVIKMQNTLVAENIKAATTQGLYFICKSESTVEKVLDESYKILRSNNNEKLAGEAALFAKSNTDVDGAKYLASKLTKEDFLDGIKNKDFFFFYQPIYELKHNGIIGVEVLTRLNHKKYGFLMADDFMAKAIEYGIMSEITSYMLDNVLGQKKFWSTEWNVDLDMTINLALSDLQSGIFAEMLEEKLFEFGINPRAIVIDIPEVVLTEDYDSVSEEFYMLSKIGVKLSIDHFGKDSINLKYIERLPLDAIKIDGSIINNMNDDDHKKRLVSSIVLLGHGLGLKVGANHVDSKKAKLELEMLGCDFAQGYYFGKAVPAFEITEVIKGASMSI